MATAVESLEDFITCGVCLNKFTDRDPRSLPCLHAFCLTCIEDIHQTASRNNPNRKEELKCPKCQQIFAFTGSVKELPRYFQASQVNDILGGIQKQLHVNRSNNDVKIWTYCSICKRIDRDPSSFCFTCSKFLCLSCRSVHDINERFKKHVVVLVTKHTASSVVCQSHQDLVDAFCKTCLKPVCKQCQIQDHGYHEILDFALAMKTPLTIQPSDGHITDTHLNEELERVNIMKKDLKYKTDCTRANITAYRNDLLAQIDEQYKELMNKLDSQHSDVERQLHVRIQHIEENKTILDKTANNTARLKQPIPELPNVSLENIEVLISDVAARLPKSLPALPSPAIYHLKTERNNICLGTLCYEGQMSADDEVKEAVAPAADKGATECPFLEREFLIFKEILQVIFLKNKDPLVVVDGGPENAFTVVNWFSGNKGLKRIKALENQNIHIRHVSSDPSSSKVAFLSDKRIFLYFLDRTESRSFFEVRYPDPRSVVFTLEGDIVVGLNNGLIKYSNKRKVIWKRKTEHACLFLTIDSTNRIIVTGDDQKIHVYDYGLSFPNEKDAKRLIDPRGTCAGPCQTILVADASRWTVVMFSSDGHYLRDVVKVDGCCVDLDIYNDRFLIIATYVDGLFGCDFANLLQVQPTCAADYDACG